MKTMAIILAMILAVGFAFGQAGTSAPVVSNVEMEQSGRWVNVTYDLAYDDDEETDSFVTLLISDNGGTTFRVFPKPEFLEGAVGSNVTVGEGKEIRWHIHGQFLAYGMQGILGEDYRARVIARREGNDGPAGTSELVTVQGTSGATFTPGGLGYFNPGFWGGDVYDVSLASFQMSRFVITQAEYEAVMSANPSWFAENPHHPVEQVTWYNAIEYCNRRSLQDGLTPAYSYLTDGTNPDDWPVGWNSALQPSTNISCNWDANGYRLPTEMEWEYAARGGVTANSAGSFGDNWAGTGDEGELEDYAWYQANNDPNGTKAVGTKNRNEMGLYDMNGNVDEWCWDFYADYPEGAFNNPQGPATGTWRVLRGGGWDFTAANCTVSRRNSAAVTATNIRRGFRILRNIP